MNTSLLASLKGLKILLNLLLSASPIDERIVNSSEYLLCPNPLCLLPIIPNTRVNLTTLYTTTLQPENLIILESKPSYLNAHVFVLSANLIHFRKGSWTEGHQRHNGQSYIFNVLSNSLMYSRINARQDTHQIPRYVIAPEQNFAPACERDLLVNLSICIDKTDARA